MPYQQISVVGTLQIVNGVVQGGQAPSFELLFANGTIAQEWFDKFAVGTEILFANPPNYDEQVASDSVQTFRVTNRRVESGTGTGNGLLVMCDNVYNGPDLNLPQVFWVIREDIPQPSDTPLPRVAHFTSATGAITAGALADI